MNMAKARMSGSGWHKQSVRHSNARRFGTAGSKYSVVVEGRRKARYRGRRYDTFGCVFKAVYNDKSVAIKKAKEKVKEIGSDATAVVYELDPKDRRSYTSGRQMSSGVYYTMPRTVRYYSERKPVFKVQG